VAVGDGGYSRLWVFDLAHGTRKQITFSKYDYGSPVWSADGAHILFARKEEHYSLNQVDSLGAERERLILDTGSDTWPLDMSLDGQFVLYGEGLIIGRARSRIWVYPMSGKSRPYRLLEGEAIEGDAKFSPNGRWVAYTSNESGRDEVYVIPFVATQRSTQAANATSLGKWQLSNSGGRAPRWRQNSKELFYLAQDNTLTAVPISIRGSTFAFEAGLPLFRANPGFYRISYDVSPDGSRFIVNTAPQERTAPITVVENWVFDMPK
jgi:hypothetical protein